MTKRLVVGRDDVSAWGTALSFKQGSKSVVVTNGSGWNDYKSEKKISDTAVNLAMTRVDVLPNQIEKWSGTITLRKLCARRTTQ